MVGPDREDKGGIVTVVNQYFDSNLKDEYCLKYVKTSINGNKLIKLLIYILSLIKIIVIVPRVKIVHIHMASRNSYRRKRIIAIICNLFDVPYIIHLHGGRFHIFYNEETSQEEKKNIKKMIKYASNVIVLSENWKEFITSIVPDANVTVVYNAVEISSPKTNYDNSNILFLGKVCEEKGIYDIIDAVAEISNPKLKVYIGGNGDIDKIKKVVINKNIENQIHFLGWINKEEKEKLFDKCSMFLLPSYNEGLPMAMLEAMSHGLAVIASNVGGIPSAIIDRENGMMVKPGDVNMLKKVITEISSDVRFKQKLGDNARISVIKKYSLEKHMHLITSMYNQIIEKKLS